MVGLIRGHGRSHGGRCAELQAERATPPVLLRCDPRRISRAKTAKLARDDAAETVITLAGSVPLRENHLPGMTVAPRFTCPCFRATQSVWAIDRTTRARHVNLLPMKRMSMVLAATILPPCRSCAQPRSWAATIHVLAAAAGSSRSVVAEAVPARARRNIVAC